MNTLKTIAMLGLIASPVFAGPAATTPVAADTSYSMFYDKNLFAPGEGDPQIKQTLANDYGFHIYTDMAYSFMGTPDSAVGASTSSNYFLLNTIFAKSLIKDEINGGLWLRGEVDASLALDEHSRHAELDFNSGVGSATYAQLDILGQRAIYIPEIVLSQFYMKKRLVVSVGMIDLTNYFDAVGIANSSFSSFMNSGFINSTILPLPYSNLGGMVQYEINENNYVMGAIERTATVSGYNPFESGRGMAIIGEYGHTFDDGKTTIRVNPFVNDVAVNDSETDTNYGLVMSVEYNPSDYTSLFMRTGFSGETTLGTTTEFSIGTHVKLIPSREDDFFGIAFGTLTPAGCSSENENILEVIYSFQVSDYFKIVPHFEYINNAAYSDESNQCIFGIQTVLSF